MVHRIGWIGYGWAELIALPSYFVIHAYTSVQVDGLRHRFAAALGLAAGLLLFWQALGWMAGIGVIAVLLWPRTWQVALGYCRQLIQPAQ
jgi:PST family polysaccharide transporter